MDKHTVYYLLADLFKGFTYIGVVFLFGSIIGAVFLWASDATLASYLLIVSICWTLGFGALHSVFQGLYDEHMHKAFREAVAKAPPPLFCSHCGMQNPATAQACALCRKPIGHVEQQAE